MELFFCSGWHFRHLADDVHRLAKFVAVGCRAYPRLWFLVLNFTTITHLGIRVGSLERLSKSCDQTKYIYIYIYIFGPGAGCGGWARICKSISTIRHGRGAGKWGGMNTFLLFSFYLFCSLGLRLAVLAWRPQRSQHHAFPKQIIPVCTYVYIYIRVHVNTRISASAIWRLLNTITPDATLLNPLDWDLHHSQFWIEGCFLWWLICAEDIVRWGVWPGRHVSSMITQVP